MTGKKRGLGRGLDALLGANPGAGASAVKPGQLGTSAADSGTAGRSELQQLPVDLIQRGKYQPRRDIEPEGVAELADSIRAQGVMQPIVVRPVPGDRYEIIAGERRWRAAQLAGLDVIPAVIRDVPDEAAIAMSLIENIQREDLNPIEEAMALQRLQQEFELTQQEVAAAVGKSRSTVTNLLRLMSLHEDVRRLLEHGDLEMGHARALLGAPAAEQSEAARTVVARGLSVRQTEAMVRRLQSAGDKPAAPAEVDPNIRRLRDDLSERLGTRVAITDNGRGKGKLVISYNSLDELDGILSHIK